MYSKWDTTYTSETSLSSITYTNVYTNVWDTVRSMNDDHYLGTGSWTGGTFGTQTAQTSYLGQWPPILMGGVWDGERNTTPPPAFTAIAVKRAEQLLDRLLTSKQRRYWHRNRYVDIRSPAYPNRLYRIPAHGQIMCFDSGKLTKRLCIYSLDRIPLADKIVALKVMIESDEQEFLKIAIPHPIREVGRDTQTNMVILTNVMPPVAA